MNKKSSPPGRAAKTDAAAADYPRSLFRACCDALRRGDTAANPMLGQLQQFPDCTDGWVELGATLLGLGQPAAADAAFDIVLRSTSSRVAASGKAEALIRLERPQEAVDVVVRHVPDWTRDAAIVDRLGQARYASGDWAGAESALANAVAADPNFADAWFRLGLVRQDSRDWPGAIDAYAAALSAHAGMFEAALNRGICQQEAGSIDAAMVPYAKAVALHSPHASTAWRRR